MRSFFNNVIVEIAVVAAFILIASFVVRHVNGPGQECAENGLRPFDKATEINSDRKAALESLVSGLDADRAFKLAVRFAEDTEDEFPTVDRDRETLYLLKLAANRGSAKAANEIGAALYYCYMGVEQDLEQAEKWLTVAASDGDRMAKKTLRKLRK